MRQASRPCTTWGTQVTPASTHSTVRFTNSRTRDGRQYEHAILKGEPLEGEEDLDCDDFDEGVAADPHPTGQAPPPGPPGPQTAINAASPPQVVNQDDVAVIEVEQSSVQDDSIIEQAEAGIGVEQPRIQDDSVVEHPDIRQAQVVSRRDGPIVPYIIFSDEDSAEEGNLYLSILPFCKSLL